MISYMILSIFVLKELHLLFNILFFYLVKVILGTQGNSMSVCLSFSSLIYTLTPPKFLTILSSNFKKKQLKYQIDSLQNVPQYCGFAKQRNIMITNPFTSTLIIIKRYPSCLLELATQLTTFFSINICFFLVNKLWFQYIIFIQSEILHCFNWLLCLSLVFPGLDGP